MSENLVESIRTKTEETDYDSILKSCIGGGYTKRSVLEYLSHLKQQQQTMKDSYNAEIQRLLEEKENLQAQLAAREDEQPVEAQVEVTPVISELELARMRQERAALEQDMEEAIARIKEDETRISRLEDTLSAERQKAEKAREDAMSFRIMLETAQKQRDENAKLLSQQAVEIARLQEEEKYLNQRISEGELSELNTQVEELMGSVALLQNEIAVRDEELETRASRLKVLTLQAEKGHALAEELRGMLEQCQEQNEWLEIENNSLGDRLQEMTTQSIGLHRELSRLRASNGILQRKLNAAWLMRQNESAPREERQGGIGDETLVVEQELSAG